MGSRRPHTTVVLALSADGKIADGQRSPARFSSPTDQQHLEQQIVEADGVLFGAGTLRTYGTTLRVTDPELLQQRTQAGKPPQPAQIVCSRSANIDPSFRFFQQPVPRWLLTTETGRQSWGRQPGFDQILAFCGPNNEIDWNAALEKLLTLDLERLVVLGGGTLIDSMLQANLIDELWLTVCPLILGGESAPTPVDGAGFSEKLAPHLKLQSVEQRGEEVFLHYCLGD